MITRDQFTLQLDRLIDTFGEKQFSSQREHLIWEAIDGLEYRNVIEIVDEFLRSSKYAPLPVDFIKAAGEYRKHKKRYALGELKPYELAACKHCLDSGFIQVYRKDNYEDWAKWHAGSAPCHCDRGRDLVQAGLRQKNPIDFGPQWHAGWETSYKIIPYAPPGNVTRDADRGEGA